jgi:hypothetical protein
MFFESDEFQLNFWGGADSVGDVSSDGALSFDSTPRAVVFDTDWIHGSFGDQNGLSTSPSFLNGGFVDFLSDFLDLVSTDINVNQLLDDSPSLYLGNGQFGYGGSDGALLNAFVDSLVNFHYYDVFGFLNEYNFNDYSYQYNFDNESDGYLKEYV